MVYKEKTRMGGFLYLGSIAERSFRHSPGRAAKLSTVYVKNKVLAKEFVLLNCDPEGVIRSRVSANVNVIIPGLGYRANPTLTVVGRLPERLAERNPPAAV